MRYGTIMTMQTYSSQRGGRRRTRKPNRGSTSESVRKLIRNTPKGTRYDR